MYSPINGGGDNAAPDQTPPGQGNFPTGGGYNPGTQVTVPAAPSVPDIPGGNYPPGGGYNPGSSPTTPSYGKPAAGTSPGSQPSQPGAGPQEGYKPTDPNNPGNPTYKPQPTTQPQAPGPGGGGQPDLAALMKSLGMDPAIQKQYADQQQQYLDFYTGKAFDLQKQLAAAQATGDWEGVRTLQGQLQDVQLQITQRQQTMAEQQQQMNNLLQSAGATGMYGNAPTQSFQQLMNQYALTQGNQNLTARGQDLSAMGVAGQYGLGMAGQYGNQASQLGQQQMGLLQGGAQYSLGQGNLAQGYGNTLTGVLGAQAGYDVQMQQLQNQLAQSPLVAWYTARGLPPPQSAIQSAQQAPDFAGVQKQQMDLQKRFADQSLGGGGNPLMQQYLDASQKAGTNQQTAFDRLMNKQDPNFNLGKFTPPDLKWSTQPNNPNAPRPTVQVPDQPRQQAMYDDLMGVYKQMQGPGGTAQPFTEQTVISTLGKYGIPASVASQMYQQDQDYVKKTGSSGDFNTFSGILNQTLDQYNQMAGPIGLPFPGGPGGQSPQGYTPPGAGSYGQYQPPAPGGGRPQEPGAEGPNPWAPGPQTPGGGQGPFARSSAMTSPLGGQGAAGAGGGPGMGMQSQSMLAPLNQGGAPQPPGLRPTTDMPYGGRMPTPGAPMMQNGGLPQGFQPGQPGMTGPTGQNPFARSGAMVAPEGGDGRMSAAVMPGGMQMGPGGRVGGRGMQGDILDRNGQMLSPGMGRDQMRPPMPGPMPAGQSGMPGGQMGGAAQGQPPPNVPPMSNGAPPWAQAALSGQNLASFTGLGSALPFLNPQQWNNLLPQEKQAYLQLAQSQGMSPQDFLQAQQNSQPEWGAMPGQARYQSY